MRRLIVFAVSLIVLGCGPAGLGRVSVEALSSEFVYETAPFPSCHASTVLETGSGLLAAWFGGSYESHPDVSIYCSTYGDGGWSGPVPVADGVQTDSLRYPCWNPVLFRLADGAVALFYKVGPNPREWWGEYKLSYDEGVTWSAACPLPDGMLGPIKNKPLAMPDGSIVYPTSVEYTPDCWRVFIERSEGDLSGWSKIAVDNNGLNAIQPALFFRRGKLEMLCRTQEGVLAKAVSGDYGRSWSPLERTELPNNNSGIDGVTLKSGLRLLVCNPITQGRNVLSLLGSYDGVEWKNLSTLEDQPEGEFSYPAIICRGDGTVDITYTYNRKLIKHVHLKVSLLSRPRSLRPTRE